jgi:EAL and modified HD-GYP domain-containing signal transduction protein
MAENSGKSNSSDYFMMGLFSLIDAMLDNSMSYLMEQLPLTGAVIDALSKRQGDMFCFLQVIECYEIGNWVEFDKILPLTGVDSDKFPSFYLDAVGWADNVH